MHVDENLTQRAVLIFARAQIHLVATDHRLLRIALAPLRQLAALRDDALHNPLGDHAGFHPGGGEGGPHCLLRRIVDPVADLVEQGG